MNTKEIRDWLNEQGLPESDWTDHECRLKERSIRMKAMHRNGRFPKIKMLPEFADAYRESRGCEEERARIECVNHLAMLRNERSDASDLEVPVKYTGRGAINSARLLSAVSNVPRQHPGIWDCKQLRRLEW